MKQKYDKLIEQKKGVAGLNIFLAIIAMLFMIGILVMVFLLAGSRLSEQLADRVTAPVGIANETITMLNNSAVATSIAGLRSVVMSNVIVTNASAGYPLLAANYSTTAGYFIGSVLADEQHISPNPVNVSFNYTYLADNSASAAIIDTTAAIGTATDWFSTFITLAALVVLVLLVVIIINGIRGAGIMDGA